MRSLTEFMARPFRAGVMIAAVILGLAAGYQSAFASPVSPDPIAAPADGAGGVSGSGDAADSLCWRCPPGIYPIIVYPYPCATPVGATGVPTLAPPPAPTPGGMASTLTYRACPQTTGKIPPAVEVHAVAAPWEIYGYGMLRNPNVPYHPMWNSYRTWLSIRNPNVPYSRCNPVVWSAGCP